LSTKENFTTGEIATALELSPQRTRAILSQMVASNIIVSSGGNKNRTYSLKKS